MKTFRIALILIVAALGAVLVAAPAAAQSGSVSIGVNANFQHALRLIALNSVEFGTSTIGPGPGTLILDPATGDLSVGGGALQGPAEGTYHVGSFRFTAPADGHVSIYPVNPQVNLTGGGSGETIQFSPSVSLSSATVAAGDVVTITVGGSINFGNNTTADNYSGAFDITVAYA